jgi:hypothetical protein
MPEIDAIKVNNSTINDISLNYGIVAPSGWEEKVVVSVEQSLKELSFKELIKKRSISDDGYFCQISIKYVGPIGGGIEFLTGLSFGIIPTYSPECDWYDFEYQLFKDLRPIKRASYKMTCKCFNWILVAPIAWGPYNNQDREKEVIKDMSRHFFSDIKL